MAHALTHHRRVLKAWHLWFLQQTGPYTRSLFVALVFLTLMLSGIYHIAEVTLGEGVNQSYFRTLCDIAILLLSGFDVSPPSTTIGWVTAFFILIINILFIGAVIQGIGEIILKAKGRRLSGMCATTFKDHTVVFGLHQHSRAIMDLYLEKIEQYQTRIVLVDEDLERLPVGYAAMPDWVEFVKGNPFDEKTLDRANLKHAKAAIICPREEGIAAEADSHAILIALAVERYNPDVVSTLILRDRASRIFLEKNTANGKIAVEVDQVICPDEIVESLTANAALNPGLASFILDVVSYEDEDESPAEENKGNEPTDDNIILVEALPDNLFDEPDWREKEMPFAALVERHLTKNGAMILGLQTEERQRVLPQGNVRVGNADALVLRKE